MAAPISVKAIGKWKSVSIDPKTMSSKMMAGFVSLQELTDYDIISGDASKLNKKVKHSEDETTSMDSCVSGKKNDKSKQSDSHKKEVSSKRLDQKTKPKRKKQTPKKENSTTKNKQCDTPKEDTKYERSQDRNKFIRKKTRSQRKKIRKIALKQAEKEENEDSAVEERIKEDTKCESSHVRNKPIRKKTRSQRKKMKKQTLEQAEKEENEDSAIEDMDIADQTGEQEKEGQKGQLVKKTNIVDVYEASDEEMEMPANNKKTTQRKRKSKEKHDGCAKKKLKNTEEVQEKPTESLNIDMSAWKNLFVPEDVMKGLKELGFSAPTPIQTLVLPSAIRDRMDIIGAAETGSGKTLAFGIPLLHQIIEFKKKQVEIEESSRDDVEEEEEEYSTYAEIEGSEEDDDEEEAPSGENDEDPAEDSEEDESTILDFPAIVMESESEDDDEQERDLSPDEDEETMEDLEEGQTGCVRVLNNVTFDWMEEAMAQNTPEDASHPLLGLVLTPTRELAIQVSNHLKAAAKYTDIHVVVVVGGMAAQKQKRLLRKFPEIVVATPGRLWEMIQEGEPHLSNVEDIRYLVIDEADRMVEKGHFEELSRLLEKINVDKEKRKQRQTFVFSATLSMVHSGPNRYIKKKKKVKLTSKQKLDAIMEKIGICEKPKIIDLTKKEGTAESLTESRISCTTEEKDLYLYYFLNRYPARTLVFCNSKDCVRRLVTVFTLLQCCPLSLHADMHQKQRLKNLDKFKSNPRGVLLATDVAARGLDIPNVQHVIHYQVPKTSENYVHRSGRTARALREGLSVTLIGPEDQMYYKRIVKTLSRDEHLPLFPVESDYLVGIKPRVDLARQIDKQEHRIVKQKVQNSWFERAAKEMDIDLDETHLHSLGDDREQAESRRKIDAMKSQLKSLLRGPILSKQFSGKYPTKSGKLELPYIPGSATGGAVDAVKGDQIKSHSGNSSRKNKSKKFRKRSK